MLRKVRPWGKARGLTFLLARRTYVSYTARRSMWTFGNFL